MPLSLACPHCQASLQLHEPLPRPSSAVLCPSCGRSVRVILGEEEVHTAQSLGRRFADPGETPGPIAIAQPGVDFGAPRPTRKPAPVDPDGEATARSAALPPAPSKPPPPPPSEPPSRSPAPSPRRWLSLRGVALGLALVAGAGVIGFFAVAQIYGSDLPSIEELRSYRPPTVTVVTDHEGRMLGEIYEQRRYVLPIEQIPERVQQAFLAAEDANFHQHGGIDYGGIARAMGRNLAAGRVTQGGSTITQQVAKNMLLTNERALTRKIQEALLAWRIEDAYTKEHILYLYLNEIFLGSQAYGVEAAARTFFGKHVEELTLGEAALLAGLPPRPSAWNPHADLQAALGRRHYVLGQMVEAGFISRAEADAAEAEVPAIMPRGNRSWGIAPHFVEHVRRQLIDAYGETRVLHEGLQVRTTCDLTLQQAAQRAVANGAHEIDEHMGYRRVGLTTLADEAAITALRAEHQLLVRARLAAEDRDALAVGDELPGILLEVTPTWARVAVGEREGIIPLAWSLWVYPPDPTRSYKYRTQDDLTRTYDFDDDGTVDGSILRAGDVVQVRIDGLDAADAQLQKAFKGAPVEADHLALRLRQAPEVESALLTVELSEDPAIAGAVRAMVGGVDFTRSQLNRATQAYRQVGSTFKPIVYAAALGTKKVTTATILPDAPLAYATDIGLWKPGNYGDDYRGNITMRQALALSRNTSTIRLLDAVDPGMNADVVWTFARSLGIGGQPLHELPEGEKPSPENDHLCPWLEAGSGKSCIDRQQDASGKTVCRACDLSMGLGSASLTMEELTRAYAVIANRGRWVQPWTIVEVLDRDGQLAQPLPGSNFAPRHAPVEPVQVVDPAVAALATWLLENVATSGTGYQAHRDLGVHVAGKTGTTNDEKDAWFVGFTPDVVTAVWVGFDEPRSLGGGATGGAFALPIWVDAMKVAVAGRKDRAFPMGNGIVWTPIDEATGEAVVSGGRSYPFLPGTVPEGTPYRAGEARLQDLATEL